MADLKIPNKITDAINQIAKIEAISNPSIDIKPCPTLGNSFNGELFTVTIKGKTNNGDKVLELFVKSLFEVGENTVISVKSLYETETFVYKELAKVIDELQTEAKVPEDEKFKMVKYYHTTHEDVVVMDDMIRRGYKILGRTKLVSMKFAELAIKELAKLHSFSLILKQKRPEFFEKQIRPRKNVNNFNKEYESFVNNMLKKAEDILETEDEKKRLRKFGDGLVSRMEKLFKEDSSNVNVLVHGDYRHANIVVKEENGDAAEIIPIDYQTIYYGNPMHDLIYFFLCGTELEFRKKHLTYLKDYYYDCQSNFLKYFGMAVEDAYPKKAFEEDFKSRLPLFIFTAIQALPFILAEEDDVPDIAKGIGDLQISTDSKYVSRMREIVKESIDFGVL